MNGDDLAHILRFLYGDERGLGIAQAARDIGTKPERLREMLSDKRPVPAPWADYLRRRIVLLGYLDGRKEEANQLIAGLSSTERREFAEIVYEPRG